MSEALGFIRVAQEVDFQWRALYYLHRLALAELQMSGTGGKANVAVRLLSTDEGPALLARFALALVTDTQLATALDAAGFDQSQVSDSVIEARVAAVWEEFSEAY